MKGSTQNLINNSAEDISVILGEPCERPLSPIEKKFLLHADRGDCATVRDIIQQYKDNPVEFDINCVDPLNRSALITAIENENIELIKLLLEENIKVNDALLHAIREEYVEGVELLLQWEESHHQPGEPYSWEKVDRSSSSFTPDITPLILAAHKNNYEIIKILLDRGATLPMPHDVRCGCDECVASNTADSLRHSQARINAYRALTSPSLIALSSRDPILTAFELSWELRRLSKMETEFRAEYIEMKNQVEKFASSLLDHVRTSFELEVMLNYNGKKDSWEPGERQTLDRLKMAIKYKQKQFVAHPNVQQLLAAIWYEGLPGFRRKRMVGQMVQVAKLGAMFPVYCTIYMFAPESEMGKFMKKPFVKFICHSSSYAFFLMLLGAASQRVEVLALEWFGPDWVQVILAEWKRKERGTLFGIAEYGVILYVISLMWGEVRSLWSDGLGEYIQDLWNILDFITNMFYVLWLTLRMTAWFITWRDEMQGKNPFYPREMWHAFEPTLIAEGAFAAGMIFSFLKLVHIFSVNPHLGPLQISLGRMIIDIVKFFFIYTLVLFAFGCGLNQLLWYYAELEKNKCYHTPDGLPDFQNNDRACTIWRRYANLFETSQSLFWASFGLVDLMCFELTGIKGFTRFWALLMFGSYSVINVIVLLNMLIAMMSNSYQIISERSDTEWKFARSRLWISYFDDGDTLPPPFNIMPTPKVFLRRGGCTKKQVFTKSFKDRSREEARERHEVVMRLLIRRYITVEQRKRDEFNITEDDVTEIRQDISTLKYEILDTLRQNGMRTPRVTIEQFSGKKGKTMERRILKDFHIGIVETIVSEMSKYPKDTKNVFGHIARAIGRKTSQKKKDWNTIARRGTIVGDPIGSTQGAENLRAQRQSLRKHILSNIGSPETLDRNKLLEYNPKLSEMPKGAGLAYAKFMSKKIEQDYKKDAEVATTEISIESEKAKTDKAPGKTSVKFASPLPAPKPQPVIKVTGSESNDSQSAPADSSKVDDKLKDSSKDKEQKETKTENNAGNEPGKAGGSGESKNEKPVDDKPKVATEEPKTEKEKGDQPKVSEEPKTEKPGDNQKTSEEPKISESSSVKQSSTSQSKPSITVNDEKVSESESKKDDTSNKQEEVRVIPEGRSKLTGAKRTGWI